jgi:ATP-binding cassette subfamily B protein
MVFTALRLAAAGSISPGDIVLVVTMIFRMRDQMLFIGSHLHHLAETWGEVKESLEEIVEPHEIVDVHSAKPMRVSDGALDFKSVTFVYGSSGREVMSNFVLSIPGRQKVGLVGKSGAGKSTLVKILLRHYDLKSGQIMIDGQNIAKVTQDSLREAIAVVPQEPLLFHRTLRENIAYGNPQATNEEIEHAARLAQAHEFISALPMGYETLVGERGVKLSGGERQRVAIARAILKNAPILVLDEATASLDSESEVAIQKALHELMQGKTVIAIAHRLSTLREMDRIIVLDRGQIVEEGTHQELLDRGGIYSELWRHQAGGFLQDE